MNIKAPQYPEALRKAEEFVRATLKQRNGREPDAQTVASAAKRVVRAVPPYENGKR